MRLSGADIIVKTLIEQGCDTVFGYPGGQILNVYDSLYTHQNEINHILTAHEQGAAHAADGYARATGKVGVVNIHLRPRRDEPCHRDCDRMPRFRSDSRYLRKCSHDADRYRQLSGDRHHGRYAPDNEAQLFCGQS